MKKWMTALILAVLLAAPGCTQKEAAPSTAPAEPETPETSWDTIAAEETTEAPVPPARAAALAWGRKLDELARQAELLGSDVCTVWNLSTWEETGRQEALALDLAQAEEAITALEGEKNPDGPALRDYYQTVQAFLEWCSAPSGTWEEAIAYLWEEEPVSPVTLARYRKVALRLKNTLMEYGISEVVEAVDGKRRIIPRKVRCDLYDYLSGREEYAQLFKGSYLTNYSWGETTLAELSGTGLC